MTATRLTRLMLASVERTLQTEVEAAFPRLARRHQLSQIDYYREFLGTRFGTPQYVNHSKYAIYLALQLDQDERWDESELPSDDDLEQQELTTQFQLAVEYALDLTDCDKE